MSQAKVDRNKEQKRNVKKIMAKEKRNWMLTQIVLFILGAAIVIWLVVAAYQALKGPAADPSSVQSVSYTINSSALEDYLSSLDSV